VRKAKGDGHLRRGEILDAAERIFIAEGYEGATIRKIADEVGLSATALYMHFPDKACILGEICRRTLENLLARNQELAAKPVDAVTRVRMMLEAYVRFGLSHPNTYRLVFCDGSLASVQKREVTDEVSAQCFERFSGVVREIAADGRLRTGEPRTVAQTLWVACHGMAAMLITRPGMEWADPEEFTRVMIEGLLFGLIAD